MTNLPLKSVRYNRMFVNNRVRYNCFNVVKFSIWVSLIKNFWKCRLCTLLWHTKLPLRFLIKNTSVCNSNMDSTYDTLIIFSVQSLIGFLRILINVKSTSILCSQGSLDACYFFTKNLKTNLINWYCQIMACVLGYNFSHSVRPVLSWKLKIPGSRYPNIQRPKVDKKILTHFSKLLF